VALVYWWVGMVVQQGLEEQWQTAVAGAAGEQIAKQTLDPTVLACCSRRIRTPDGRSMVCEIQVPKVVCGKTLLQPSGKAGSSPVTVFFAVQSRTFCGRVNIKNVFSAP
jgi:hypothetical protein